MKLTEEQACKLAAVIDTYCSVNDGGYPGSYVITQNAAVGVWNISSYDDGPSMFVITPDEIDEAYKEASYHWDSLYEELEESEELTPKQVYEGLSGGNDPWYVGPSIEELLDESSHI